MNHEADEALALGRAYIERQRRHIRLRFFLLAQQIADLRSIAMRNDEPVSLLDQSGQDGAAALDIRQLVRVGGLLLRVQDGISAQCRENSKLFCRSMYSQTNPAPSELDGDDAVNDCIILFGSSCSVY